jgi:hypothetical protein
MKRFMILLGCLGLLSSANAGIFDDILNYVAPRKEAPKSEAPTCRNDLDKVDGQIREHENPPPIIPAKVEKVEKATGNNQLNFSSATKNPATSVKEETGPWKWKKIGGDPFGERNVYRAMRLMGFSPSVIQTLEAKIAADDYEEGVIRKGDTLERMISGEYEVKGANGRKVLCAWQDGRTFLPARLYRIDGYDGRTLVIIRPDICFNWCYIWEKTPPPPVIETPPDTCPPPDTVIVYDSIPCDTTPTIVDTVPDDWGEPEPEPEPSLCGAKPSPRLSIWALHDFPTYGPFRRHGAGSYGLDWDMLFVNECAPKQHQFGFTLMGDFWDGESRAGFNYWGFELYAGPMAIFELNRWPGAYLGLDIGPGIQFDWGRGGSGYPYEAYQTSGFARMGMSLDFIWTNFHWSTWASGKVSFAESKESSLNGVRYGTGVLTGQTDLANKKHGVDGGMRFEFARQSTVHPLIVWRESWAYDDGGICTTLGGGLRFGKHVIWELSWKNRTNSDYGADAEGNSVETLINVLFGHK